MIHEIECKTALTNSKLSGLTYSLNPYKGCTHGCVYCYVPNVFRVNRAHWYNNIYVKKNINRILIKELRRKKKGVVGLSTSTDAYQPAEKKFEITRECIKLLKRYSWPIDILTKSDLIVRDIDLLADIDNLKVGFTIPTINDSLRKLLEPNAPSINRRLNALRKISDACRYTYVFLGPLYPDFDKLRINEYMEKFISAGIQEIIIDTFHLKRGIRENIVTVLPSAFKDECEQQINRYSIGEIATLFQNYGDTGIKISTAFL